MRDLTNLLKHQTFELYYISTNENHHDAFKAIDHNQVFFTVILDQEYIDESLTENPSYFVKTPATRPSWIDIEISHLMKKFEDENGSYMWIHDEVKKHYPNIDSEYNQKMKEFEYYYSCLEKSQVATALRNCELQWAQSLRQDDGEDFEIDDLRNLKKKRPEEYAEFLKEVFMPLYEYEYEPNYKNFIPAPLYKAGISHRGQYFAIKKGEELKIAFGSSIGSGTRQMHGFCGHLFALIQKRIKPVPSFILKVTSKCELKLEKKSDNLILMEHDLTGNYRMDREKSKLELQGIELY